jgi:hypothetical protein
MSLDQVAKRVPAYCSYGMEAFFFPPALPCTSARPLPVQREKKKAGMMRVRPVATEKGHVKTICGNHFCHPMRDVKIIAVPCGNHFRYSTLSA